MEKATASHDVAPEVSSVGQPAKNPYIGISEQFLVFLTDFQE